MTMHNEIDPIRTAEGTPATQTFILDMFSNDWSLIGGLQDLHLAEDTVPATTSDAWVNMQGVSFWLPTYALDDTFDSLQVMVSIVVHAKADGFPDASIRLIDGSNISNVVPVNNTSYQIQDPMILVLEGTPTGYTNIAIQGNWIADPAGGELLYVRRSANNELNSDCEIYVRITP